MALHACQCRRRIGVTRRIPLKIEAGSHLPYAATVECEHVAGHPTRAQFLGHRHCLVRGPVVGARDPQAQAPQRHIGCTAGQHRIAVEHLRRIAAGKQEQIERLVVDNGGVGAMRPFRIPDAVHYPARRVDQYAPGTALRACAGPWTPAERHALVGEPGVDAQRVVDARGHELPPLVKRPEFLAQTIDRFTRSQCKGGDPLLARPRAADHGQTRKAAIVLVGDRCDDRLLVVQQPNAQRFAGQFEAGPAGGEGPYAGVGLRDVTALRAADHQAVVGPGIRADAQAEHAGTETGDFEHVAGTRREGASGGRHAEAARSGKADKPGRVKLHRRPWCLVLAGEGYAQPANFASGIPGTSARMAKIPPDCGSRNSSSGSRRWRAVVT